MTKKKKKRDIRQSDRIFLWILKGFGFSLIALLLLLVHILYDSARPIFQTWGWGFFLTNDWDVVNDRFGGLAFIFGTIVSSFLAILLAGPVAIGTALVLTELAKKTVAKGIGFLVEMLAAIPSVVYGLWGIFVLAPWLRENVQPFLAENFGFLPLFQGTPFGLGMMTAGVILAIMITPTVCAISREVFSAVSQTLREGAMALGATRWETIELSVLRSSVSGIVGAIILGLGRALGETMAVTMVIGNRADISWSLFNPAHTMSSIIANEYADASSDLHVAALMAVALGLFIVSLVINSLARLIIWNVERQMGRGR